MASLQETTAALAGDAQQSSELSKLIHTAQSTATELANGMSATGSDATAATVRSAATELDTAVSLSTHLSHQLDKARDIVAQAG